MLPNSAFELQKALLKNIDYSLNFVRELVEYSSDSLYKQVQSLIGLDPKDLGELYLRLQMAQAIFQEGKVYEKRTQEFEQVWKAILFLHGFSITNTTSRHQHGDKLAERFSNGGQGSSLGANNDFAYVALEYCMNPENLEKDESPLVGFTALKAKRSL